MPSPGTRLREQARTLGLHAAREVIILAGATYAARAREVWPHATTPLAGRGIGRQKAALAAMARTGAFVTAA
ncbi:hypothetical protein ADL21_00415 [Streptomyces albus subsp. albus]|nr:hypothetical protein ADL21_00415 [Streptomyces albus subsp. albus]